MLGQAWSSDSRASREERAGREGRDGRKRSGRGGWGQGRGKRGGGGRAAGARGEAMRRCGSESVVRRAASRLERVDEAELEKRKGSVGLGWVGQQRSTSSDTASPRLGGERRFLGGAWPGPRQARAARASDGEPDLGAAGPTIRARAGDGNLRRRGRGPGASRRVQVQIIISQHHLSRARPPRRSPTSVDLPENALSHQSRAQTDHGWQAELDALSS